MEGLQPFYRRGLAHLDDRSRALTTLDFRKAPSPVQVLILSDQSDSGVQDFVGQALSDTINAMYGPPEYGGNHGLAGWKYTNWPGDRQPKGFRRAQVTQAGNGSLLNAGQAQAILPFLKALGPRFGPGGSSRVARRGVG